jgi:hypothetical protein
MIADKYPLSTIKKKKTQCLHNVKAIDGRFMEIQDPFNFRLLP